MKESAKETVTQILTTYLESYGLRRTPERFAILDAAYSFGRHFTLEELSEKLVESHFRVSRATLYNTLRLLITLRLVVSHRLLGATRYEACYAGSSHCHQICTVCGKVAEIKSPEISQAVEATHLKRFHRDVFSMYIYGICSACQAKQTRLKRQTKNKKTIKSEK